MKWIIVGVFLFFSHQVQSQNDITGDWYLIGTEKLHHFRITKDSFSWRNESFLFKARDGEDRNEGGNLLLKTVYINNLVLLVAKTNDPDTSNGDVYRYSVTVLQYHPGGNVLDLGMECSDAPVSDTTKIFEVINECDTSSAMRMRFYNKSTIQKYRALKSVTSISQTELKKIKDLFKEGVKSLTEKYGEDKLLWVAPILFQQVLTELLVKFGYNPMLTEKQAETLFSFHYY